MNALKELFNSASQLNVAHLLNPYFSVIFSKVLSSFYRADILQANMLGAPSAAINEIAEKCDHINLKPQLKEMLVGVLQEVANSMDETIL
jgi:hypothetical protein